MNRAELLNVILELDKMGNIISMDEQISNLDWMLEDPNHRMIVLWYDRVKLSYSESEGGFKFNPLEGDITDEYIEELNRISKFYKSIVKP